MCIRTRSPGPRFTSQQNNAPRHVHDHVSEDVPERIVYSVETMVVGQQKPKTKNKKIENDLIDGSAPLLLRVAQRLGGVASKNREPTDGGSYLPKRCFGFHENIGS